MTRKNVQHDKILLELSEKMFGIFLWFGWTDPLIAKISSKIKYVIKEMGLI